MTLSQFLIAWYPLMHQAGETLTAGAAGGGREVVFGGTLAQAVLYAIHIGGQAVNALGVPIWPGP